MRRSSAILAMTCLLVAGIYASARPAAARTLTISPDATRIDGTGPWRHVLPGDTLVITPGRRAPMTLIRLRGTAARPIVVRNGAGKVEIDGALATKDRSDGIDVYECAHVVIDGRGSRVYEYGIVIHGKQLIMGIKAAVGSTNIHIYNVEAYDVGFAGFSMKSEPSGRHNRDNFVMYDSRIIHCYAHDLPGEGYYLGYFNYFKRVGGYYPHLLDGVILQDSRAERCGRDGIQVGSMANAVIAGNRVADVGLLKEWGQTAGIILNAGPQVELRDNVIERSSGPGIECHAVDADIHHNTIIAPAGYLVFIKTVTEQPADMKGLVRLHHNTGINPGNNGGVWSLREHERVVYERNLWIIERADLKPYIYGNGGDRVTTVTDDLVVRHLAEAGFRDAARRDYRLRPGVRSAGHGADRDCSVVASQGTPPRAR